LKLFLRREAKKIVFIALGSLIYSIGVLWFLNPTGLYTDGVTGITQLLLNIVFEVNGKLLNLGLFVFIFNVPIMIFGMLKLSRKFVYYSIYATILVSIFLGFIPVVEVLENDILANALVGGILTGVGAGIAFRVGGSAGGFDVLFQYIAFNKNIPVGIQSISVNLVIIGIAGAIFSWPIAVYTIIRVLISNLVIDKVHTSYNFIKLEVITEKGEEMSSLLVEKTNHGVTVTSGRGAYSKKHKDILHTIISSYEVNKFIFMIKEIDESAFITVSSVKKVVGNFAKIIID
jgi:uncharacterized membrane-anchored protein YitT (DUF2179 family)